MARRKKKLPDISDLIQSMETDLAVKLFPVSQIPQAVAWAEQGNIAIHENYLSRRKQSYHVISGQKEGLLSFCDRIGLPHDSISASEFFRFWHLTWTPPQPKEEQPKRIRRRTKRLHVKRPAK